MAEKKTNLFNFGKGWLVIVLCMIMFYMICAIATDGTNLTAPNVAAILGVDQGAVITRNGYAGLAAIIYFIVMSQLAPKLGGVKIGALNMIIASIGFYFMQNPTSLNMYTICCCCFHTLKGSYRSCNHFRCSCYLSTDLH